MKIGDYFWGALAQGFWKMAVNIIYGLKKGKQSKNCGNLESPISTGAVLWHKEVMARKDHVRTDSLILLGRRKRWSKMDASFEFLSLRRKTSLEDFSKFLKMIESLHLGRTQIAHRLFKGLFLSCWVFLPMGLKKQQVVDWNEVPGGL